MAKKDYIPRQEAELLKWCIKYKAALPGLQAKYGLSDDEVTAQTAACDAIIAAINANETAQHSAQGARKTLNTTKSEKTSIIRKNAQHMKTNSVYDENDGEALGIVGDENEVDEANSQPKLSPRRIEGGTELKFSLEGYFDAVKIFRQRPGEGKVFIATDTSSPYNDTAEPQVNGTGYTAWFVLNDETVGLESDPVVVQV